MAHAKHTPGPWSVFKRMALTRNNMIIAEAGPCIEWEANLRLIVASPDLLEALKEGRRAIGDHVAPTDCYATGPLTGDPMRDLVECPACSFILKYDAAIAKAEGAQ